MIELLSDFCGGWLTGTGRCTCSPNMVTTSSLEALGVDLNGTTSNPLWILFADFTFFTSRCLIMSIL